MVSPSDLKPERTMRALERAGWENLGSIPSHGGKPLKPGLVRALLKKAGMTWEEFLEHYR